MVSVNEPLLNEDQLKENNLMNITVEAAYSVPDAWNPSGTQYMYTATMPIPLTAEVREDFNLDDLDMLC